MRNTIEVPQEALSLRSGDNGEVLPEKGDPVNFMVEGTIRKVNEGWCLVDVRFINGHRPGPPENEFIREESDEEDDLRSLAENADMEEGY
jgi:hypothetical protein